MKKRRREKKYSWAMTNSLFQPLFLSLSHCVTVNEWDWKASRYFLTSKTVYGKKGAMYIYAYAEKLVACTIFVWYEESAYNIYYKKRFSYTRRRRRLLHELLCMLVCFFPLSCISSTVFPDMRLVYVFIVNNSLSFSLAIAPSLSPSPETRHSVNEQTSARHFYCAFWW